MTPYSTRQSTVAYSGYISFSVPLSFCLGTVRQQITSWHVARLDDALTQS